MPATVLPHPYPYEFLPVRKTLYQSAELFHQFDPKRPESFKATYDFKVFAEYIVKGRSGTPDYFLAMMQALHDQSINQALLSELNKGKEKVPNSRGTVGIMGGHDLARGSELYERVGRLGQQLAQAGFTVITGGGPGAMEAAHLGVLFSESSPNDFSLALTKLRAQAKVPSLSSIVTTDESAPDVPIIDDNLVAQAHAWFSPAFELAQQTRSTAVSFAIPTWFYGHEPTTPFATHVAKYFQNSIREDGLLALATHGVVFATGSAGTLQEVFQDNTHNYYARSPEDFSPVVFFGSQFWNDTLPVPSLLKTLFKNANREADYNQHVRVLDDPAEIVEFLRNSRPPANPVKHIIQHFYGRRQPN